MSVEAVRVLTLSHHASHQAELQTNSQRVTLADTSPTPQDVVPGQNMDIVISHEVKELGKHTCVVSDIHGILVLCFSCCGLYDIYSRRVLC